MGCKGVGDFGGKFRPEMHLLMGVVNIVLSCKCNLIATARKIRLHFTLLVLCWQLVSKNVCDVFAGLVDV